MTSSVLMSVSDTSDTSESQKMRTASGAKGVTHEGMISLRIDAVDQSKMGVIRSACIVFGGRSQLIVHNMAVQHAGQETQQWARHTWSLISGYQTPTA